MVMRSCEAKFGSGPIQGGYVKDSRLGKPLSTGQSEEELLLDELVELLDPLEVDGVEVLVLGVLGVLVLGVLAALVVELESELPELLRESLR